MVIELARDALKSLLVPKPFMHIGRVGRIRSFEHCRRLERFLYHHMPKNMSEAIKIPRAKPTEIPITTKSPL
jgi:hypothetical protein